MSFDKRARFNGDGSQANPFTFPELRNQYVGIPGKTPMTVAWSEGYDKVVNVGFGLIMGYLIWGNK